MGRSRSRWRRVLHRRRTDGDVGHDVLLPVGHSLERIPDLGLLIYRVHGPLEVELAVPLFRGAVHPHRLCGLDGVSVFVTQPHRYPPCSGLPKIGCAKEAPLGMRVAVALLLLSLCGHSLHAQAPAPPLEVPYTQFTLANGLTVILHRETTVPVVSANTWYHAGSANERPGRTGFAHLFEHLMFEGSKNVEEGQF